MKWLIVNRNGAVYTATDDLELAWKICEVSSRCGKALTVQSATEYEEALAEEIELADIF